MKFAACLSVAMGFSTLAISSSAFAVPVAYDGFAGTGGTLSNASNSSGGTGDWAGSTWSQYYAGVDGTMNTGSLSSPTLALPTTGNSVIETGAATTPTNNNRSFSYGITSGGTGTIWFSFLMQRQDTNNGASYFEIKDGGSVINAGYFGGTSNWQMQDAESSYDAGYGFSQSFPGVQVSANNTQTALFVIKVYIDNITGQTSDSYADLWVNPTSTTEFSNPATATQQMNGLAWLGGAGSLNGVGLLANTGTSAIFDEVRIGSTYLDVVPEPATAAIFVLPALCLLTRRRRAVCAG